MKAGSGISMAYDSIMKLLFHGTKETKPEEIFMGEEGFDFRFSNAGFFGEGIYFAEDPAYSHEYAYRVSKEPPIYQMFISLVNVGRFKSYK